nr:hypothetical protein [Tanacetum cinerariifolium]
MSKISEKPSIGLIYKKRYSDTPRGENKGIEGPMIIEAEIGGHCIHRIYVDGGSASEILYEHCFNRLRSKIKNQLMPATTPLIGFSSEIIRPLGQIQLLVKIRDEEHSTAAWTNFVVVRSLSSYNEIIGRPGVRKLQLVPSTAHEKLKLLMEGGLITLKRSRLVPLECAMISGPERNLSATKQIVEERVKAKERGQTADRNQAIHEEVGKLVEAGIMKEVHYHDWLSNPVMLIAELLMLTAPVKKKELIVYLAAAKETQASKEILSSTSNHSDYGPANTAGAIKTESSRDATEVEHQIRRICNTLQTQGVSQWVDISKLHNGFGAGLILTNPEEFTYALRFRFDATNHEAEYEALIVGLRISEQIVVEEEDDTWMTPIFEYLAEETLPADVEEARAVRRKSHRFAVINGNFYKNLSSDHGYGPEKVKFLIVAMDYSTKWIEAKPVATITGNQFRDNPFKDWCEKQCIRQHFASAKHPQTNGLVKRSNRNLKGGIKASNGDTPFSLTYVTKAVIPTEIGMTTLRIAEVDLIHNNEALEINLDLLKERKEQAAIHEAKSKAKMERYYNSKVRNTFIKPGDLVYHNNDASRAEGTGKLGPK